MWTDLADNVDRQLGMVADPEQQIDLMLQLAQLTRDPDVANPKRPSRDTAKS